MIFKVCRKREKCVLQMLIKLCYKYSRLWSGAAQNARSLVRACSLCSSISLVFPEEWLVIGLSEEIKLIVDAWIACVDLCGPWCLWFRKCSNGRNPIIYNKPSENRALIYTYMYIYNADTKTCGFLRQRKSSTENHCVLQIVFCKIILLY